MTLVDFSYQNDNFLHTVYGCNFRKVPKQNIKFYGSPELKQNRLTGDLLNSHHGVRQ